MTPIKILTKAPKVILDIVIEGMFVLKLKILAHTP